MRRKWSAACSGSSWGDGASGIPAVWPSLISTRSIAYTADLTAATAEPGQVSFRVAARAS